MTDLIEKLKDGCIYHAKRWSGDTHDDLGGSIDEAATDALMREAAEEITRLRHVEVAFKEFLDKTEWVQQTAEPRELGRHRADVLLERLKRAESERDFLVEEYERAVGCGPQGYLHAAMHLFNAITNAKIDAKLAASSEKGAEPVTA